MNIDAVIMGIMAYLDGVIYKGMSDWQQLAARVYVDRLIRKRDGLQAIISSNPLLAAVDVMSPDGYIDVDGIAADLREQLARMGQVRIESRIFGNFTFRAEDVDTLLSYIKRGG